MTDKARWHATVWYRTDAGETNIVHLLEELGDLEDKVEKGPHWDTISRIDVRRINHIVSDELTVEAAEKL